MSYYSTKTEIATTFKVSKTTVTRWIKGAEDGRNNLQINRRDKKIYVLKNEHNNAEMLKLKEGGVKYKGSTNYIEVSPKNEFYEIFSIKEQIEIINLLNTKKTIPLKFSYFGKGADMWDKFYINSLKHNSYPEITYTQKLIQTCYSFILDKISSFKNVNIVDIGLGNGYPLKALMDQLIESKVSIKKYIAVDISNDMLEIAEANMKY